MAQSSNKMKDAFHHQRHTADLRCIPFTFSFEEWCQWWESQLGPDWFQLRGCKKGQYVMARKRDKGPYSWWNVKCLTASENVSECRINGTRIRGARHHKAKLTESEAAFIKTSKADNKQLAEQFQVTAATIGSIKVGRSWKHL